MTVEPYPFIRAITLTMAGLWTVRSLVRMVRFLDRWETRIASQGFPRVWMRRQALILMLRASVLDPLNLALLLLLTALWCL